MGVIMPCERREKVISLSSFHICSLPLPPEEMWTSVRVIFSKGGYLQYYIMIMIKTMIAINKPLKNFILN